MNNSDMETDFGLRRQPDRVIGGVCAGLGQFLKLDPRMLRIGWIVSALFGGMGVVTYLIFWMVIPDTSEDTSAVPWLLLLILLLLPFCVLSILRS